MERLVQPYEASHVLDLHYVFFFSVNQGALPVRRHGEVATFLPDPAGNVRGFWKYYCLAWFYFEVCEE